MNRKVRQVVASVEESVRQLIELCRKNSPLYERSPAAVAHVSRTSKWLLNAIDKLDAHLETNAPLVP